MTIWSFYLYPLAVTMIGFCLLWPVSVWKRDASIVDAWWAPGFVAQVMTVILMTGEADGRTVLMIGLISIWALRLTWVLVRRRVREGHEDPRYQSIREAWGESFWWKSLFIVFVLQAVIQWLIVIGPIRGLLAEPSPLGFLAALGAIIAVAGILIETKADAELDTFKRQSPDGGLCQSGLRARVRHPNYVGEIIFWIGIGLVVSEVSLLGGLLAPALITLFLTKVSGAPMIDERLSETRAGYQDYRARVPGFIPRLNRRTSA